MTLDALESEGYTIEKIFLDATELATEAVSSGSADFGEPAGTVLQAIGQGAAIKIVGEEAGNGWSILVTNDIQNCADLDGKRLAIHSEGSLSAAMVRAYLAKECPEAKPEFLILEGSENRAAALIAGQIDATPAELSDQVRVIGEHGDRFRVLTNFAETLPELMGALYVVNSTFAEDHPDVVLDVLRTVVDTHRRIADDPTVLQDAATEHLELDPASLPAIVQAYADTGAFNTNGGLTRDRLEYTLDFLTDAGAIEPGVTVDQAADFSFLDQVLQELGEQ
jgi:NitT/TauT family transport system substrate-binding protein